MPRQGLNLLLLALCLDRHARHLRRHVDELDVLGRGQPRLSVVHRERSQHGVVVRENRGRPDRAQSVADRDVAALLPERVCPGVLRVYGFSQERRGPARAHVGSDAQERIDARLVILRDPRRRGEPQPLLLGIGEQHGAAHSLRLFLDQPDQRLENLSQRRAVRDPLEHAALAVEKRGAILLAGGVRRHDRPPFPVPMPARARSSDPNSLARRAASRSPA